MAALWAAVPRSWYPTGGAYGVGGASRRRSGDDGAHVRRSDRDCPPAHRRHQLCSSNLANSTRWCLTTPSSICAWRATSTCCWSAPSAVLATDGCCRPARCASGSGRWRAPMRGDTVAAAGPGAQLSPAPRPRACKRIPVMRGTDRAARAGLSGARTMARGARPESGRAADIGGQRAGRCAVVLRDAARA